jgi:WD40 repeat protein
VKVVPVDGGDTIDLKGPGEPLRLVAIDPDGRYVAAAEKDGPVIRVWDLGSGELVSLDAGDGLGVEALRMVSDGRLLVRHTEEPGSYPGLSMWDVASARHERVFEGEPMLWRVDPDAELVVSESGETALGAGVETSVSEGRSLILADVAGQSLRRLDGFAAVIWDLDAAGSTVVSWDFPHATGPFLQVGRASAAEPYLVPTPFDVKLYGFPALLSPNADRIAQGYGDGSIWLFPVPDLESPPPHTLPTDEFIAWLKTLTNRRVVRDPESETGWKLEVGPFPGWETVPTW